MIDSVKELQLLTQVNSSSVTIIKLNETTVEYSVVVDQSFSVCAKKRNTVVSIRDLLGFQRKLERYSQLEAIIHRVKNASRSLKSEVRVAIDDWQNISTESDHNPLSTKSCFLLRQLELNEVSSKGKRYTSSDILTATKLFLVSRPCYRVCRSLFSLPHPDTLKLYLGGLGSVDTYNDCRNIIQTNFKTLSGESVLFPVHLDFSHVYRVFFS